MPDTIPEVEGFSLARPDGSNASFVSLASSLSSFQAKGGVYQIYAGVQKQNISMYKQQAPRVFVNLGSDAR
jgi:hypothetical protein